MNEVWLLYSGLYTMIHAVLVYKKWQSVKPEWTNFAESISVFATEVLYDHNITTNVLYNRLICGVSSMLCVLNGVCSECKHNIHSIHFNLGGLLLQKETKKSTTHWHTYEYYK